MHVAHGRREKEVVLCSEVANGRYHSSHGLHVKKTNNSASKKISTSKNCFLLGGVFVFLFCFILNITKF